MTRVPETTDSVKDSMWGAERSHAWKRVATAAALGAVSVATFGAQQLGITSEIDDPWLRAATESLSHPVLGYVGAYIGVSALAKLHGNRRFEIAAAAAGATVINFATEFAQDITIAGGNGGDFLAPQNTGETIKDYAFALAGAGLYVWQSYVWRKKSEQS